jgi:tetratricopeptide (TPR) repeat protein
MSETSELQDHLSKAEGYLMLGMYEEALDEATQAIALDAASYAGNYLKGVALISLRRYGEAEAALSRAVALEPERAEAFVHLAYVHRRTVSLDKAVETISKAIELQPDMALANYNLACYYALKGEDEEALRYLGRAVNIAPHFREAARADEDFSALHGNSRFRRLVELE